MRGRISHYGVGEGGEGSERGSMEGLKRRRFGIEGIESLRIGSTVGEGENAVCPRGSKDAGSPRGGPPEVVSEVLEGNSQSARGGNSNRHTTETIRLEGVPGVTKKKKRRGGMSSFRV